MGSLSLANYVLPTIGDLSVKSVDTGDVTKMVELLWRIKKNETVSRLAQELAVKSPPDRYSFQFDARQDAVRCSIRLESQISLPPPFGGLKRPA